MTPLQIRDTVRRYIGERGLLPPGPVVVAVSGGADSSALLLLLADLAQELGLVLHVAHFDHRIRRAGAVDAQHVSDLAAGVGATIRVGRAERVPRSEDDARVARYAFLRRVAADRGASVIATGHTRDDQAETVLLHLSRGSGIAGLAGMRPSRDGIVRPLLCIGRAETEDICRAARIVPREDPTNRSLRYARNRIRRKVLPELEAINPQVTAALARLAESAQRVADATADRAERALGAARREDGSIDIDVLQTAVAGSMRLDMGRATAAPDAGGDRPGPGGGTSAMTTGDALALAWHRATGDVLAARHREALTAMCARRDGTMSLDLPGGRAVREYGLLRIEPRVEGGPSAPPGDVPLPLGGSVEWDGWRVELGTRVPGAGHPESLTTRVPASAVSGLTVRSRRAGDRIAEGGPKVQDLLTDAKIPVRQRDHLPVVTTADGSIGWIPGVASAWNAVSDGYVLVAHPPAAWRMRVPRPRARVASS